MGNHWADEVKCVGQSQLTDSAITGGAVILSTYFIPDRLVPVMLEFMQFQKYSSNTAMIPSYSYFLSGKKVYFQLYELDGQLIRVVT